MKQPSIHGMSVLRHGLQVLAFCCVVAVFTTMIWPDTGYLRQWVYSVCIGGLTWLTMEFGRLLVPAEQCHSDVENGSHGWPKGWRGLALTACGIALGFTLGSRLAAQLLGDAALTPQRDMALALLVTVTAGVVASAYFHARGKQAALQALIAAAERDTTEARLMLLQSQLEPHMLFNTLATLRALIAVDPPRAEAMLDRMVDFLRATLSASRAPLHPLSAEFARLADYLELMAVRMGPRLAYALHLPPELAEWNLALQCDGAELEYVFDSNAEKTGVPSLMRRLSDLGIGFKDLSTRQSSLEDIFVGLVHQDREAA